MNHLIIAPLIWGIYYGAIGAAIFWIFYARYRSSERLLDKVKELKRSNERLEMKLLVMERVNLAWEEDWFTFHGEPKEIKSRYKHLMPEGKL